MILFLTELLDASLFFFASRYWRRKIRIFYLKADGLSNFP